MYKFLVDGRVTSVMLFLHVMKRSVSEGGPVAGGMATQSRRQNLLLHSCEPCEQFDAHSFALKKEKPRMISLQIETMKGAQCKLLVRKEARAG